MSYFRGIAGEPTSVFDTGIEDELATKGTSVFNTDSQNAIVRQARGEGREWVRRIQQRLKAVPLDPGPIDGIWGPKTCGACLNFQRKFWGDAKKGYLDQETFLKLGFDPTQAAELEKDYGLVCGGTPPEKGGLSVVGPADVKKIQEKLGVPQTGVWDAATCKGLFAIQQKTGNYGRTLLTSTFVQLGFPRPYALLYAGAFQAACGPFWVDQPKPVPNPDRPPVDVDPGPKPSVPWPTPIPVPPPLPVLKAGFSPWILVVMGGGLLVLALAAKKRKR